MKNSKFILAIIAGLTSVFAPLGESLNLLIILMIFDLITGFTSACLKKQVQSRKMWEGIIKKVCIFLFIAAAAFANNALYEWVQKPLVLFSHEVTLQLFVCWYYCLEECISLLENFVKLGLPVPKWLRKILKAGEQSVSGETIPDFLADIFKDIFKTSKKGGKIDNGDNDKQDICDETDENA